MSYSIYSLQEISAQRQAELIGAAEHSRLRRLARRASGGGASHQPAPFHRRWLANLGLGPVVAR